MKNQITISASLYPERARPFGHQAILCSKATTPCLHTPLPSLPHSAGEVCIDEEPHWGARAYRKCIAGAGRTHAVQVLLSSATTSHSSAPPVASSHPEPTHRAAQAISPSCIGIGYGAGCDVNRRDTVLARSYRVIAADLIERQCGLRVAGSQGIRGMSGQGEWHMTLGTSTPMALGESGLGLMRDGNRFALPEGRQWSSARKRSFSTRFVSVPETVVRSDS